MGPQKMNSLSKLIEKNKVPGDDISVAEHAEEESIATHDSLKDLHSPMKSPSKRGKKKAQLSDLLEKLNSSTGSFNNSFNRTFNDPVDCAGTVDSISNAKASVGDLVPRRGGKRQPSGSQRDK